MATRILPPSAPRTAEWPTRARSLANRVLAATIYRSMVLQRRRVIPPVGPPPLPDGYSVSLLGATELDAYLALRPDQPRTVVAERIARGHEAVVVRHDGAIVHAHWMASGAARLDWLDAELPLAPHEGYAYDSWTAEAHRGRRLTHASTGFLDEQLTRRGITDLLRAVFPENIAGLQSVSPEFTTVGTVHAVRSPRRWITTVRRTHARPSASLAAAARYWDSVIATWPSGPPRLWRRQSDAVHGALLARWLPPGGRILKTDLFDEAIGDGLAPELLSRGAQLSGIDVAPLAVERALARHPQLTAQAGDVRRLPFGDASFDAVVSTSTLDHFDDFGEAGHALVELGRVLRPGGLLVLTVDNRANPLLALRTVLPGALLERAGVTPYAMGASRGPRGTAATVRDAGFELVRREAILHFPRVLAARLPERTPLRVVLAAERLHSLPSRWLTAHYVAVLARKPQT